jgi:hypothetical protein
MKVRDRVIYIHIPKTGGTFILNTIFNKNNLQAEHKVLSSYKSKDKIIFITYDLIVAGSADRDDKHNPDYNNKWNKNIKKYNQVSASASWRVSIHHLI